MDWETGKADVNPLQNTKSSTEASHETPLTNTGLRQVNIFFYLWFKSLSSMHTNAH